MLKIFDQLRSLQEILSEKFEIEKEIKEIPKILATKLELLNRIKKIYLQKNEDYENTKKRISELKRKLEDAGLEREQYEKQMDVIKTQREYEALDKEIKDATQKEINVRQELEYKEKQIDEMKASLEKEGILIQKQEEEVKLEQSRIKQEIKDKTKSLQKLEKEESKITPGLDDDILFKFERIIRSKSGLGIVPIIQSVCTGCHMILPSQFVNDVRNGKSIMFCPECSRILFFEESDGSVNMDMSMLHTSFESGNLTDSDDAEEDDEEDDDSEESPRKKKKKKVKDLDEELDEDIDDDDDDMDESDEEVDDVLNEMNDE